MIVKTKRIKNYTTVPNDVINNKSLSYNALGLWLYLMSKPTDWVVRMDDIKSRMKNEKSIYGRDLIRNILNELKSVGLAELIQIRDQDGVMHGSSWVVYDTIAEGRVSRQSGFPTLGKTTPIVKTDISNTYKQKKEGTHPQFNEEKALYKIIAAIEDTPQGTLEIWAMQYRIDILDIQDHGQRFGEWWITELIEKYNTSHALETIQDYSDSGIRMKFQKSFLPNIRK